MNTWAAPLQDPLGRELRYVRLSVTERCNLRCSYCLPDGCPSDADAGGTLSVRSIGNLAEAFSSLGFVKIRITGGEPTLRRDLEAIIETAASRFSRVGLSTNGLTLVRDAKRWKEAGLTHVNVSLDSRDSETLRAITGSPHQRRIEQGIEAAVEAGLSAKVNVVLLGESNAAEVPDLIRWASGRPMTLRFIELMNVGLSARYISRNHRAVGGIEQVLLGEGWVPVDREGTAGPAREYRHRDHMGRIGFIEPSSTNFCSSCNRIRVTARGLMKMCLFGDEDVPLFANPELAEPVDVLTAKIRNAVLGKPAAHRLASGNPGNNRSLASCGG